MEKVKIMGIEMADFCKCDYKYISMPYTKEIPDIKAATDYFNLNFGRYVALDILEFPYCVRENVRRINVKTSHIIEISEFEKVLMTGSEYADRLKPIIAEKCVNCRRFVSEQYCINGSCGFIHIHSKTRFCVKYTPKKEIV